MYRMVYDMRSFDILCSTLMENNMGFLESTKAASGTVGG